MTTNSKASTCNNSDATEKEKFDNLPDEFLKDYPQYVISLITYIATKTSLSKSFVMNLLILFGSGTVFLAGYGKLLV